MTELTKHHERVIEAAIVYANNLKYSSQKDSMDIKEAIEALQASQQPKIDLKIKDLPVGTEIMVSEDGELWQAAYLLNYYPNYHGSGRGLVHAYFINTGMVDFGYAKLSPTAKTHLIWHENTGEMPCDGEQAVIIEYQFDDQRLGIANNFDWVKCDEDWIKRYCILS